MQEPVLGNTTMLATCSCTGSAACVLNWYKRKAESYEMAFTSTQSSALATELSCIRRRHALTHSAALRSSRGTCLAWKFDRRPSAQSLPSGASPATGCRSGLLLHSPELLTERCVVDRTLTDCSSPTSPADMATRVYRRRRSLSTCRVHRYQRSPSDS